MSRTRIYRPRTDKERMALRFTVFPANESSEAFVCMDVEQAGDQVCFFLDDTMEGLGHVYEELTKLVDVVRGRVDALKDEYLGQETLFTDDVDRQLAGEDEADQNMLHDHYTR